VEARVYVDVDVVDLAFGNSDRVVLVEGLAL
jgi:hypothetical protein